jgi:hypothetical protein
MLSRSILDADQIRITADGFMIATPRVARSGVELHPPDWFRRHGHDFDGLVRVYRPSDELFNAETLRSLCNKPVCLDHPPKTDPVTAKNWKKYAVGHTSNDLRAIIRDGEHVRVPLILFDADGIDAVRSGKARQLSFAYRGHYAVRSGVTPDGEPYDAIETNVRFTDHLAIVDEARGGPTLSIGDTEYVTDVGGRQSTSVSKANRHTARGLSLHRNNEGDAAMPDLVFTKQFADGSPDFTSPFRPGFRFLDTNDANRIAANDAYEARRQAMHYANKRRRQQQQDDAGNRNPTASLDLDQARAIADSAYQERSQRMANAWRNR